MGFLNKEVKSRFKVWGSTKQYDVCEYDDGTYSCNCPAWIFHRGERVNCKHILELINKKNIYLEYKNIKTEVVIQGTDNLLQKSKKEGEISPSQNQNEN